MVALDLTVTEDLARRGWAREVVRQVQDLRKKMGLEVSDRIRLVLEGVDDLEALFGFVGREVLAVEVSAGPGRGVGFDLELDGHPGTVRGWIEKA